MGGHMNGGFSWWSVLLLVAVSCRQDATGPTTGAVRVVLTTTGAELDPDGYSISVDGGPTQPVDINGTITLPALKAGDHSMALSGVAANCAVNGDNPRTVNVSAGGTALLTFSVTCVLSGRIVFQSTPPGGTPDLLVMDPDGNNVRTLLGGPSTDQSPAASPDGSRIAFSSNRDGDFDIYVMNRDGTG